MAFPVYGGGGPAEVGGPAGHTYAAVLVRSGSSPVHSGHGYPSELPLSVVAALRAIRFSGWVAREPADGWVAVVPRRGAGTVAAGRRGVAGVGEMLAGLGGPALAVRVLQDRQLLLVAWDGGAEAGRYVSDPSREPGAGDDLLAEPYGVRDAPAIAAVCGRPDAGEDLTGLLREELDPESTIESERLGRVARLLGLPTWLVAIPSLPRDIPTGPSRRDWIRLGAGLPGVPGRLAGWAADVVRKRRPPPPAVTDAPRGNSDVDPWLM